MQVLKHVFIEGRSKFRHNRQQYQISTFQEERLQFLTIYCHIFGSSEQVLTPPPPSKHPFLLRDQGYYAT